MESKEPGTGHKLSGLFLGDEYSRRRRLLGLAAKDEPDQPQRIDSARGSKREVFAAALLGGEGSKRRLALGATSDTLTKATESVAQVGVGASELASKIQETTHRGITRAGSKVSTTVKGVLPEVKNDGSASDQAVGAVRQILESAELQHVQMLRAEQKPPNRHAAILASRISDEKLLETYNSLDDEEDENVRIKLAVASLGMEGVEAKTAEKRLDIIITGMRRAVQREKHVKIIEEERMKKFKR